MSDSSANTSASSGGVTDPSGFLESLVTIVKTSRQDVNGCVGKAISYNSEKARYSVKCADGSVKNLKVENLTKGNQMVLSYKYKIQGYRHMATASPQAKEALESFKQHKESLDMFLASLPTAKVLNAQTLFIICCVVFNLHAYYRGLAKTFMLIALLYYPTVLFLPCWRQTRNVKSALGLIVRVSKDGLVNATGQQWITESMVGVAMMLFLFVVIKAIVASPPATATAAAYGGARGGVGGGGGSGKMISNAHMDKIYAAGFNDATEGKLYGASLGQFFNELGASTEAASASGLDDNFSDEFSDNYVPPEDTPVPAPNDNSLGFAGTISLALGAKLIFDLGKDDNGGWNPANFPANAQRIGPMRMAMPMFGLARLLPKIISMVMGR